MVKLTAEQRVLVVIFYTLTQSVTEVQNVFKIRFTFSYEIILSKLSGRKEVVNTPLFMYN